ncbi:MAG: MFS transporter [Gemmatimonadota bacterium]
MTGGGRHAGGGRGRRVASWEYRAYTAAQAVSLVGTSMGYAALYWLTIHLAHGRAALLSILVAAQFLPILLASRRAGTLVARYPRNRVLLATQVLQAAGALAIGVPLLAGWMTVWYLCAVSFAVGWVLAVDVTARQMFMLDLVGEAELRRGTSLYGTVAGLAKIAGPAAAGLIIAAAGEAVVFLADAVSFLAVVAVLLALRGRVRAATAAAGAGGAGARRFRWVLDLPRDIKVAALMALLIGGIGYQFEVTSPLMATVVFRLGAVGYGLFGTLMAAGGIAGNYYSSRRPDPGAREFLMWACVFGVAELAASVMPVVWAYDATLVVIGGATVLFSTSALVFVQLTVPEQQRGQAVSAVNAGFMGFVPAGAFAVAGLAVLAGPRWALAVPALAVTACAGAVLAATLSPRRQPAAAAGQPAAAPAPVPPGHPAVDEAPS